MDTPPTTIKHASPFLGPEPFMHGGLVWISNVDREPESPACRARQAGLTLGPARGTLFHKAAELEAIGIVGLYGPPLSAAALAAASPGPATPALGAEPVPPGSWRAAAARRAAVRPVAEPVQNSLF